MADVSVTIAFVRRLPEEWRKVVWKEYRKRYLAVFRHFRAARNDAYFELAWSVTGSDTVCVYHYWADKWRALCPKYFETLYGGAEFREYPGGPVSPQRVLWVSFDSYHDGDMTSSLEGLSEEEKYNWRGRINKKDLQAQQARAAVMIDRRAWLVPAKDPQCNYYDDVYEEQDLYPGENDIYDMEERRG